jgi:hypothetical protein
MKNRSEYVICIIGNSLDTATHLASKIILFIIMLLLLILLGFISAYIIIYSYNYLFR